MVRMVYRQNRKHIRPKRKLLRSSLKKKFCMSGSFYPPNWYVLRAYHQLPTKSRGVFRLCRGLPPGGIRRAAGAAKGCVFPSPQQTRHTAVAVCRVTGSFGFIVYPQLSRAGRPVPLYRPGSAGHCRGPWPLPAYRHPAGWGKRHQSPPRCRQWRPGSHCPQRR